jgi:hypothetical protein
LGSGPNGDYAWLGTCNTLFWLWSLGFRRLRELSWKLNLGHDRGLYLNHSMRLRIR